MLSFCLIIGLCALQLRAFIAERQCANAQVQQDEPTSGMTSLCWRFADVNLIAQKRKGRESKEVATPEKVLRQKKFTEHFENEYTDKRWPVILVRTDRVLCTDRGHRTLTEYPDMLALQDALNIMAANPREHVMAGISPEDKGAKLWDLAEDDRKNTRLWDLLLFPKKQRSQQIRDCLIEDQKDLVTKYDGLASNFKSKFEELKNDCKQSEESASPKSILEADNSCLEHYKKFIKDYKGSKADIKKWRHLEKLATEVEQWERFVHNGAYRPLEQTYCYTTANEIAKGLFESAEDPAVIAKAQQALADAEP